MNVSPTTNLQMMEVHHEGLLWYLKDAEDQKGSMQGREDIKWAKANAADTFAGGKKISLGNLPAKTISAVPS